MDKLRSLKMILSVCENQSFAGAAKELGQSPSSISKSVTRFENDLGFKLFNRTTRVLQITEQGQEYIDATKSLLKDLDELENRLRSSNETASGVVRINVPFDYGLLYVQPFLSEFHADYPDINIEINFNDSYVNSVERKVDLLIRTGGLEDVNMVVRKLSPMDFLICAAPSYLQQYGYPKSGADLYSHRWIRFRPKSSGRLVPIMVVEEGEYQYLEPKANFVTDSGLATAKFCVEGLGLAQLPHFLAREWIQSGELVSLFPSHCPASYGVYILFTDRKYLPKRCRIFIDSFVKFVEQRSEFSESTWAQNL